MKLICLFNYIKTHFFLLPLIADEAVVGFLLVVSPPEGLVAAAGF